jgi:hypothetical protein
MMTRTLGTLIGLPLLLCAGPALAQAAPPAGQIDPAAADKLANGVQALSKALLDIRVGELQAALDGREATPAEKKVTVRDVARSRDPDFDRHFQQQIAQVGPALRQSVEALNDALPQLMQSLEQAQKSLERAAANMPDPNYPKR